MSKEAYLFVYFGSDEEYYSNYNLSPLTFNNELFKAKGNRVSDFDYRHIWNCDFLKQKPSPHQFF